MKSVIKNTLIFVSGLFIGSFINMLLLILGSKAIPFPKGLDIKNPESLKAKIHLLEPIHFITPFLAHAIGTMVGAFIVGKFVSKNNFILAMSIGFFFLLGGISTIFTIPAPKWFSTVDLLFSYIPMAFLGWRLSGAKK